MDEIFCEGIKKFSKLKWSMLNVICFQRKWYPYSLLSNSHKNNESKTICTDKNQGHFSSTWKDSTFYRVMTWHEKLLIRDIEFICIRRVKEIINILTQLSKFVWLANDLRRNTYIHIYIFIHLRIQLDTFWRSESHPYPSSDNWTTLGWKPKNFK